MNTIYKIRRRSDNLFSKGGRRPYFSKTGKTWNSIAQLKRHLSDMGAQTFETYYSDCEIVEFVESYPLPLRVVMEEAVTRRLEREQQRAAKLERWRQQRLENERERLERRLAELNNER